ncbi:helix-turn-helix transcriptional regulator [Streptomyces purpureus]|uniref:helix-turn-helix transcriptional regulator n=1 Tax=Streptomyces purpureus TaxID=1951 RepID=UPI00035C91B8|nr:helix-turn-helix transcriptional regulator [Streptomyces purpureus]
MPTFSPERLTAARIACGLSQPELGERIHKSGNAIFTYETRRTTPPTHVVGRLALALGVGAADLFEPDPDDPVLRALVDLSTCTHNVPRWGRRSRVEPDAA